MLLEKKHKTIIEEYDYEDKIRILNLKDRIDWFINTKGTMSQNEKWDAFFDMLSDYEISYERMLDLINKEIRKRGLNV